eukprot:TRINITY_DN7090_c0_g1_i3.p1 TRINITY_DN7090_c0_g1~~TRINITY_DN7090_c0_g1_i3.p1  ORF type:complete len:106 (+),score=24.94 TRINITY_DN7090_c0_g1_i3:58-375(+)
MCIRDRCHRGGGSGWYNTLRRWAGRDGGSNTWGMEPQGGHDLTATIMVVGGDAGGTAVSYTHLRAHETPEHLVCRLLLEKKKKNITEVKKYIRKEEVYLIKKTSL